VIGLPDAGLSNTTVGRCHEDVPASDLFHPPVSFALLLFLPLVLRIDVNSKVVRLVELFLRNMTITIIHAPLRIEFLLALCVPCNVPDLFRSTDQGVTLVVQTIPAGAFLRVRGANGGLTVVTAMVLTSLLLTSGARIGASGLLDGSIIGSWNLIIRLVLVNFVHQARQT